MPGPWFQLYAARDRELTAKLIEKVRAAGYRLILLTVNTPIVGNRVRDLRNGMALPPRITVANASDMLRRGPWILGQLRGPGVGIPNIASLGSGPKRGGVGPAGYLKEYFNDRTGWDDIAWIKQRFGGPVGVKGIMTADDARRARDAGADAILVSNHGGRQLDDVQASADAGPRSSPRSPQRRFRSWSTAGFGAGRRRQELSLGATACLIARPWLWGLAAGGAGVARVRDLRAELNARWRSSENPT